MTAVRYDGFQEAIFGGGAHCYTIVEPQSPAYGFGISFDAVMPTEAEIRAAVREKERQVSIQSPELNAIQP